MFGPARMYRSLFPVLLHASTVVADPAVSPEAEYTLQARVLLQDDNDARATLLAVSQDAVPEGTLDWDDVIDDLPAWLTREGIQPPSRAVMQEVSEALRIRLPRVTCTARDVVPLGSPEIAQYTLACMVPDVEPAFAAYRAMRSGDDADRDALSDAFLRRSPHACAATPRWPISPRPSAGRRSVMATSMPRVPNTSTAPYCSACCRSPSGIDGSRRARAGTATKGQASNITGTLMGHGKEGPGAGPGCERTADAGLLQQRGPTARDRRDGGISMLMNGAA